MARRPPAIGRAIGVICHKYCSLLSCFQVVTDSFVSFINLMNEINICPTRLWQHLAMKKIIPCILLALTFVGGTLWADETADNPTTTETTATEENTAGDTNSDDDDTRATTEGDTPPSKIDSGDTAWILTASALVLFMTIPGLSFFYAGLVRKKNVLSVLMHCFALVCLMTVVWVAIGYSMAFSTDNENGFIGGLSNAFASGLTQDSGNGIPDFAFFIFQMTFFIITPALMVGAFVERIKFSAMLWFTGLWAVIVYLPACHSVWAENGYFLKMGAVDLAGGIVVHITAGLGALVACIVLGPRKGYPQAQMMPHNLPMTVAGTGMLWVGWFGFNGGSGLAADGGGATAIVVTQISAATAALTWMFIEWMKNGKPTVLGIVTGSIAGLAAITPASGVVGPQGALIIGLASGFVCWYASTAIKAKFGYDDSLDVFGVHGVGGIIGTLLLAFLGASGTLDGRGDYESGAQFAIQFKAAAAVGLYTLVATWIILKVVNAMVGLRVDEQDETSGLDISAHGEAGYND